MNGQLRIWRPTAKESGLKTAESRQNSYFSKVPWHTAGRSCRDNSIRLQSAEGQSRGAVPQDRKTRVALYSHDTMCLGHIRRNLLIAQTLSESDLDLDMLLVTGSREAGRFMIPPGVDCLVLPSLYKEPDGSYRSRHLSLSLEDLIELRRGAVYATIAAFQPDILIVDNVSQGASQELDSTLAYLRAEGRTRCVLGQRDVRDSASALRAEGLRERFEQTVRRYYDQVLIYGDAAVYDTVNSIVEDEKSHKFMGFLEGGSRSIWYEPLRFCVRLFTEGVIRFGMR